MLSLEDARKQFDSIMIRLDESQRDELLSDAIETWSGLKFGAHSDNEDNFEDDGNTLDDPAAKLNSIANSIRGKVPFDGIFPSETMITPRKGENSNCYPNTTVHVDAFLYSDDEVDELEKEGKLNRYYCKDCGSKNIEALVFISNSFSREDLYYIFDTLLPTLDGMTVLDVGSRLGAVLYGAYVYTDATNIIGIEMNKDMCDVQNEVVKQFKMDKRIEIRHKRIENSANELNSSDVIILNNAFEFYLSEEEQVRVWEILKENIKKGSYIISRPSLTTVLSKLNTSIEVNEWVEKVTAGSVNEKMKRYDSKPDKYSDNSMDIICYKVL